MEKNEEISQLELPGDKNKKSLAVYLKIVFFPVLIFALLLLGYLGYISLKIELHTVIMIGFILIVALIFARHSAEYASSVFEAANDDFKQALKKYILDHFLSIGKETKCNASFDDFANFYILAMRNEQFASVGSSIFPMLGILGTFISIALSMPNFSSADTQGLESEISKLLSGVGTAFYVSIYGIFLALWWIFFEKYGISKFDKLINKQKLATSSFFWTKEEIDRRYLQESLNHFDKIGTIFEHVGNEEFFNKLNRTIDRKFQIFEELLVTEERAVKISSEHIKLTMGELSRAQREHKDLAKMHSEIVNAIANLTHNTRDINLRMSEQYNRLLDIAAEKNNQISKNLAILDQSVVAFKLGIKEFESLIIQNQNELFEGFKSSIIEGISSFKDTYQDERAIDEKIRMMKQFSEESKEVQEQASSFLSSMGLQSSDIEELAKEKLDKEFEKLEEEKLEDEFLKDGKEAFKEKEKELEKKEEDLVKLDEKKDEEKKEELKEEEKEQNTEKKASFFSKFTPKESPKNTDKKEEKSDDRVEILYEEKKEDDDVLLQLGGRRELFADLKLRDDDDKKTP